MFAGAAIAGGLWLLLQLLLTGGALSAVDADDVEHARAFGIGTTIGSVIAPLLAIFAGGLVAGRLAAHYDRKVAGLHGALVWAVTSLLGLVLMASAVAALADQASMGVDADMAVPAPGARDFVEQSLERVNQRLEKQGAPELSIDDVIDAAHHAGMPGGSLDRAAFIDRLDAETKLSRPEAEAAFGHFGDRAPDVIAAAHQLAVQRQHALEAADGTGKAMLAAGVGLLLCLGLAIFGAILGARRPGDRGSREPRMRADTIPGHTTAPYPVTTPTTPAADPYAPPETPADPYIRRDPTE